MIILSLIIGLLLGIAVVEWLDDIKLIYKYIITVAVVFTFNLYVQALQGEYRYILVSLLISGFTVFILSLCKAAGRVIK